MSILPAYALGPHHGATYDEWGVLSYSRTDHRHVLAEFTARAAAEQARDRIRHDADVLAVLMHQTAGRWEVAK